MKTLPALALLATAAAHAQIPPAPGMPPVVQAQQAFAIAQGQAMMMTNQAQLQGMIMAQANMITNVQARSMFVAQAASLQVRASQSAIFASQAAAFNSLQHMHAMQTQMQTQSAILTMRSRGIQTAAAMQAAIQATAIDPLKMSRQNAMLHALAAQASGQQAAATPPPDAASLPSEPPPMMIRPTFGMAMSVDKPKFSQESTKLNPGAKIRIKSDTHYATLYYTTNGWTPTTQSAKYTGPITINYDTHLQVIAMAPNFMRSSVEHADYEVAGAMPPPPETTVIVPDDGTLKAGTPVRVTFAAAINSETANVGDEISLVLDEDIKLGDKVLAPKGAPVNATLTVADSARHEAPGDLVFEVHSIEVAGKRIPLFGGETLEGPKGGKDAIIKPGMTALAFVAADTNLK